MCTFFNIILRVVHNDTLNMYLINLCLRIFIFSLCSFGNPQKKENMKYWILIVLLIIASVSFCINKQQKAKRLAVNYENPSYIDFEIDHKYLITEVEIDGVKVGDSYKSHQKKLKKIIKNNSEIAITAFDLYNKEKEKIGFVHLDERDSKSIGKIEIIAPQYKTAKGIGVGNTFKEIKENYPKSEVHGCEIEGKTFVIAGDYHFLLKEVSFYSYIVDESKIDSSTEVDMITIRH